jgi:hypothetical protein
MRHLAKIDPRRFLGIKRERKAKKRALRETWKAHARSRARLYQDAKRRAFGGRSLIGKMLASAHSEPLNLKAASISLKAPAIFSMMDNPEGVLLTVGALAKADQEVLLDHVKLDLGGVKTQDLAAQALLAKLADEIDSSAKLARRPPVRWSGVYPLNPDHKRLVKATGVIKQLRVKHEYLSPWEEARITLFVRHCRHYISAIRPQDYDQKSKAAHKFADYMNSCLASSKKVLTPTARHLLCSRIGELLDNAEQHAGMVDWTIKGYLDTSLPIPMCEIVIFNFGKSLADTFEALDPGGFTMQQIEPYLDMHVKRGFFGPSWRRRDLLTVMALQQGVSSKNTSTETTRGNGTTDLIEFFQRINDQLASESESGAKMTIISGSTRIMFDGTYRSRTEGVRPGVIAFNEANDLDTPPDPRYVSPLEKTMLPGTLISVQFSIPTSSLTSLEGTGND